MPPEAREHGEAWAKRGAARLRERLCRRPYPALENALHHETRKAAKHNPHPLRRRRDNGRISDATQAELTWLGSSGTGSHFLSSSATSSVDMRPDREHNAGSKPRLHTLNLLSPLLAARLGAAIARMPAHAQGAFGGTGPQQELRKGPSEAALHICRPRVAKRAREAQLHRWPWQGPNADPWHANAPATRLCPPHVHAHKQVHKQMRMPMTAQGVGDVLPSPGPWRLEHVLAATGSPMREHEYLRRKPQSQDPNVRHPVLALSSPAGALGSGGCAINI